MLINRRFTLGNGNLSAQFNKIYMHDLGVHL